MTSGVRQVFRDPDGDYVPTIRQQMRLQTFPDYYEFTGFTQKDLTTQAGNAVPPRFMAQIFEQIAKVLKESDEEAKAWNQEILTID